MEEASKQAFSDHTEIHQTPKWTQSSMLTITKIQTYRLYLLRLTSSP